MTVSHATPPLSIGSVDEALRALRERGLRASAARRLVLEALFAAERPVSAEEIAAGLAGRLPGSDLTSVYRNLEMLEELGFITHVHLGHGPGLYALAASDRGFLVCESCGQVRTLEGEGLAALREAVRSSSGYKVRFSHFPLVGVCPDCGRTTARPPANND